MFQTKNSDESQATLKNVDFDAAGLYTCEVSTDTPIFSKESTEEQLHVICEYKFEFYDVCSVVGSFKF